MICPAGRDPGRRQPTRAFRSLEFAQQYGTTIPTPEATSSILPIVKELADSITNPADPLPPAFSEEASTELVRAIFAIGRANEIASAQATLLLPIILLIAKHAAPAQAPDEDQARPVTGWGSAPRISAADALAVLARHASCCTMETCETIRQLSEDPAPAVRVQIATRVLCLY